MLVKLLPADTAAEPVRWTPLASTASPKGSGPVQPAGPDGSHDRVMSDVDPAEVERRIADLERSAKTREQAAYQRGCAEGTAAGAAKAAEPVRAALDRLGSALNDVSRLGARIRSQAEDDIVRLSVAIARKILRREISTDPDALHGIVLAALERVEGREAFRVRANPEDADAISRHVRSAGAPPRIEIVPDPSLERGSVIVETAHGNLDASASSQLAEIERGLTDLARSRR